MQSLLLFDDSGKISLSHDIKKIKIKLLIKNITVIFQSYFIFVTIKK
ncbi:hypothetical protein UYSO10_5862 [Kosakonia radicincitans]|nr:hypothetical protein UYSO10_5862 [Kosakonia radicincitans]